MSAPPSAPPSTIVTREKIIVLEASQRQSDSLHAGNYVTTLNKATEIENGDVIELLSSYIDTSAIDPNKISLEKDVDITYENGMYIMGNQLDNIVANSNIGTGELITDNRAYTFCEFTQAGTSDMVVWTTVVIQKYYGWGLEGWGDVTLPWQYKDARGILRVAQIYCPAFEPNVFGRTQKTIVLGILGQRDYPPLALDKLTGIGGGQPMLFYTDPAQLIIDKLNERLYGYIYASNINNTISIEEIDGGFFTPIIFKGGITIKAGDYTPTDLAKQINDELTSIPPNGFLSANITNSSYIPQAIDQRASASSPGIIAPDYIVVPSELFQKAPFPWTSTAYVGWSISISCITDVAADGTITFLTQNRTIVESTTSQQFSFSFDTDITAEFGSADGTTASDPPPVYPSGLRAGNPFIIIQPPDSYVDKGSNFCQHTKNYDIVGMDGQPIFAFVDCTSEKRNAFTFQRSVSPTLSPFFFGANQIELAWNEDTKRFAFDYLHYPLTQNDDLTPAIRKQVSWNYTETGGPQFVQIYDDGSVNQVATKAGGVFFTALEPFQTFWKSVMGFNQNILATINYPVGNKTHFSLPTGIGGIPGYGAGFQPGGFGSSDILIPIPVIDLQVGVNMTDAKVTINAITGNGVNYMIDQDAFATGATLGDSTGRISIDKTKDFINIQAGKGDRIGVQDSGYYIVDVQCGTSFNEHIGSQQTQGAYSRGVVGIVDRYYSANAYTSSQGGGISYIHYGNKFMLDQLNVRIMNSDRTLIDRLGTDNTIYIKVTKQIEVDLATAPFIPAPPKS